jgi:hypothetical protein
LASLGRCGALTTHETAWQIFTAGLRAAAGLLRTT